MIECVEAASRQAHAHLKACHSMSIPGLSSSNPEEQRMNPCQCVIISSSVEQPSSLWTMRLSGWCSFGLCGHGKVSIMTLLLLPPPPPPPTPHLAPPAFCQLGLLPPGVQPQTLVCPHDTMVISWNSARLCWPSVVFGNILQRCQRLNPNPVDRLDANPQR